MVTLSAGRKRRYLLLPPSDVFSESTLECCWVGKVGASAVFACFVSSMIEPHPEFWC